MQYVKIHFFQDVGVNFGVNIGVGKYALIQTLLSALLITYYLIFVP